MPTEKVAFLWNRIKSAFTGTHLPIGVLTLLGALLRFYHLGYKTLWFDEAVIYWISKGKTISEIVLQNSVQNSAPALFPILTSFALNFGETETVLRFIPWFAGVLSIPLIYCLARQFFGKAPALVSAAMVALAPTQVRYSQELREYSLVFLLATLILLFYTLYLRNKKTKHLVLLVCAMVIGVFTQYGLGVLVVALNICFLIYLLMKKDQVLKNILKWVIAQLFVLAAVLVVYFTSLSHHLTSGWGADTGANYLTAAYWSGDWSTLFRFLLSNVIGLFEFAFPRPVFSLLLIVGLVVVLLSRKHLNALLIFIVPVLLTVALAMVNLYPFGGIRQDMFLTPMIYILVGFGVNRLLELDKSGLVVSLLLFFPVVNGGYHSWHIVNQTGSENMRPIIATLKESFKPGERIYVYYAAKPAFSYYYRDYPDAISIGTRNRDDIAGYYSEINAVLSSGSPTWLVFSHCFSNECEIIPEYVSLTHRVEEKASGHDAFLYYVH